MITKEQYIEWYTNLRVKMIKSGHYLSTPQFLFKKSYDEYNECETYEFNFENWCGGDILRNRLISEPVLTPGIEVRYYCIEGQTTIFLLSDSDFYEISWYKNRGRTDIIKKNGDPITLDEYIDLCNTLLL